MTDAQQDLLDNVIELRAYARGQIEWAKHEESRGRKHDGLTERGVLEVVLQILDREVGRPRRRGADPKPNLSVDRLRALLAEACDIGLSGADRDGNRLRTIRAAADAP